MGGFRRYKNLVGVTGEVRDKSNSRVILIDDPPAILLLGRQDILEENSAGLLPMASAHPSFSFNILKDKVGRVNLAVRMRVGNAYGFSFILKNQDMLDFRPLS